MTSKTQGDDTMSPVTAFCRAATFSTTTPSQINSSVAVLPIIFCLSLRIPSYQCLVRKYQHTSV
eukprot:Nitzschia sp. Nitz4//scaffold258_size27474//26684//27183//NITZ4_008189-RA/size27474-snap-gene-0.13-mRNA-1//-1//CDS//3329544497//989//frame0